MPQRKDSEIIYKEIPFNGKLRTYDDPATLEASDTQQLTNMRPGKKRPVGIAGMTKVNTTALATNRQIRNGMHFTKEFPGSESHVMLWTRDSAGANGQVHVNDTAIPNQGDITAAAVFTDTDTTGTKLGRFSTAPNGGVAYLNGVDTCIWYGDEMKPSAYVDYDPAGSFKYDYTDQILNDLSTSGNLATIHSATAGIDSDTLALLHFDGDLTDSALSNDGTAVNGAATSATQIHFGTQSLYLDGVNQYITLAADSAWDWSALTTNEIAWEIFARKGTASNGIPSGTYFSQYVDANNYMHLSRSGNTFTFDMKTGGVQVTFTADASWVASPVSPYFSYIALNAVERIGPLYFYNLYVNGALIGSTSSATKLPDMSTSKFYLGAKWTGSASDYLDACYLDELRISKNRRFVSSFEIPSAAYGAATTTTLRISSRLPAKGIKFYVATANTTAGTASVYFINSSNQWIDVSDYGTFTDGTADGDNGGVAGVPLSETGTMSFPTTETTAQLKPIDGLFQYHYKVVITNVDATATISMVTIDADFQRLKDVWSGQYSTIGAFQAFKSNAFNDYSINVFEDSFDSTNTATYADISSFPALSSNAYLVVGFAQRMVALSIGMVGGKSNTNASIAQYDYWDGDSWVSLNADDQTVTEGKAWGRSGTVSWISQGQSAEFKQTLGGIASALNVSGFIPTPEPDDDVSPWNRFGPGSKLWPKGPEIPTSSIDLYYYRISFDAALSTNTWVYSIQGIPAQVDVRGYNHSLHHQSRLLLFGNEDSEPNSWIASAQNTSQVFNGDDSVKEYIGDDSIPVASASISTIRGSTLQNLAIVCKRGSTWGIDGILPNDFKQYPISHIHGCVAPLTMASGEIKDPLGRGQQVAVWQSSSGIVVSSGAAPEEITKDIEGLFDPQHPDYLGASVLATATGEIAPDKNEYHWIIPGVLEWAYAFDEGKWFDIDRGTGKRINCMFPVTDTNGIIYNYAGLDTGYVERLENGTDFDGNTIAHTLWMPDMALHNGELHTRTELKSVRLVGLAKTTTSTVTVSHYGDSSTTASQPAITPISMSNSGKRLFNVFRSVGKTPLVHVLHSLKFTISTNNETSGFEPIYAIIGYKVIGDDVR